jgi:hypothetical protein
MAKQKLWLYGIGFATGLYATFVLQQLWNWFLIPALHFSEISFWTMYGLHMFVALLTRQGDGGFQDEGRWERILAIVETCVPSERRHGLTELVKQQNEGVWTRAWSTVLGKAVEYTVTLGIGWAIHIFLL